MNLSSKSLRMGAAAAFVALFGLAGAASASTWTESHPRRAEINHRLANQNHRIDSEVRQGEISRGQAHALRRQDRTIRHEERFMAAQNHGHITHAEQRSLNQQENGVSREIGK